MTAPPIRTQPPESEEFEIDNGLLLSYNGDDTDIYLPSEIDGEDIVIIGGYVFRNDSTIESVSMSDDVEEIFAQAFQNCTNLKNIYLSSKITELNKWLFEGCTRLTNVVLPENLMTIKYRAFGDCILLEKLEIPETVISIDDTAFDGCDNLTLYVQAGSYAEEYAKEHGIPYVSEGGVETVPPETETPSSAPTPEPSTRPTPEVTPEATATPEVTPEPSTRPTLEATATPGVTPETTSTPEVTPEPSARPTPETTATPGPTPEATATPQPTAAVTMEPIPTAPAPSETALPYEITDCNVKGDTVEVTIRRSSETDIANLIFANYDAGGKLISLYTEDIPDADEFKVTFDYSGDGFGIYIWDLRTLKPCACAYHNGI